MLKLFINFAILLKKNFIWRDFFAGGITYHIPEFLFINPSKEIKTCREINVPELRKKNKTCILLQ